jgi:hypothetical protein
MCEDFFPNFGDKTTGCCITTTHLLTFPFFTREFLTKNDTTTLLFSISRFKIKLKGHYFDTIEVMEAESQAVLNTLTEHDFQDKNLRGLSPRANYTDRATAACRRN